MSGFFDIGSMMQGIAGLHDSNLNTLGLGYNIASNEWNKNQQQANKHWAYADSRAANAMMQHFLNTGSLEGFNQWSNPASGQDYNDVADYLNPFLSLSGLELQKNAQRLSEEQFKYSKYVTENAGQIRVNDLKKAGISPLMATGSTATFSPTSVTGGGSFGNTAKNRAGHQNLSALNFNSNLASAIANLRLTNAQVDNINADTELKHANTKKTSEDIKQIAENTKLITEKIYNTKYATKLTQNQIEHIAMQIANLQWDYDLSIESGLKTFESTPFLLKNIKEIISGFGVDTNTDVGKGLASLLATGIILRGEKIRTSPTITKTIKKGNTTITTTNK